MLNIHYIIIEETPSTTTESRQKDLIEVFKKEALQNKENEDFKIAEVMRNAVDKAAFQQAFLRLIINHDLPFIYCSMA